MALTRATVSCMFYGLRAEVWSDESGMADFLSCNSCERRFVGGTEESQLQRYLLHKEAGICGTPGP